MFSFNLSCLALSINDCDVLAIYKKNSSVDLDNYICKNKKYGQKGDDIYYSGKGSSIVLNNFNAYYFRSVAPSLVLDIQGNNEITLFHLNDSVLDVSGTGSLKFKENSFVKKFESGSAIYNVIYKGKMIVDANKTPYEGTMEDFASDFVKLKEFNKLPDTYKSDDYEFQQVLDYQKMMPVSVSELWLDNHFKTKLSHYVNDGFGIIKNEEVNKEKILETEEVILESEKKLVSKYKLKVDSVDQESVTKKLAENNLSLLSLFDINILDGKKKVSMKDNKYTIKIKLDEEIDDYLDYQVIYVNDDGKVEEYIDATIVDGYITFKTNHLSQYGVVAKRQEKVVEEVLSEVDSSNDSGVIWKVSLLVGIALVFLGFILFVVIKGKKIKKI